MGEVRNEPGNPENGMIIDFGAVKQIMVAEVGDQWDHAFLVCRHDKVVVDFLQSLTGHKTVVLDAVPTAENLAAVAAERIANAIRKHYGDTVWLTKIRLFETPNCWADAVTPALFTDAD